MTSHYAAVVVERPDVDTCPEGRVKRGYTFRAEGLTSQQRVFLAFSAVKRANFALTGK